MANLAGHTIPRPYHRAGREGGQRAGRMGLACRREEEVEGGVVRCVGYWGSGGDVGCRIWEAGRWRVREMAAESLGDGDLEREGSLANKRDHSLTHASC